MSSENAKAVAKEVLRTLGKSRKVSLRKIIAEKGYSQNTADNPKNVTETKTFQEIVKPVVEQMDEERQRVVLAMKLKNLDSEEYKILVEALDKLTKNIQLLSGGATERKVLVLPSEITGKYGVNAGAETDSSGQTPV